MKLLGEFLMFFTVAVELVKGDGLHFPFLIRHGKGVTIVDAVDKGWDKVLLKIMDENCRVHSFIIASLADGSIKSDEVILSQLRPLFHGRKMVLGSEACIGILEGSFKLGMKFSQVPQLPDAVALSINSLAHSLALPPLI